MHEAFRSLQEHQDSPQQERKDLSVLSPPCHHGPKPLDLALGPEQVILPVPTLLLWTEALTANKPRDPHFAASPY